MVFLRMDIIMKFAIQETLMNNIQLEITKNAIKDIPHVLIDVVPFSRDITSDEPLIGTGYIPYGSCLLTSLAKELNWRGLYFDLSTFNYEESAKNRDDMLNAEIIMPIGWIIDFLKTQDEVEWFIRPSEDLKQFSGQVIGTKECIDWLTDALTCESSGTYKLEADTMIVLAKPKEIQAEWRYFIVGGKIVDGAMYRAHGQLRKIHELDKNVLAEAQTFVDKWLPNPCCVMDLALLADDTIKVIEFNCINSSGFYGHDVKKIFEELYEYSLY
jgi:hypothetical protein